MEKNKNEIGDDVEVSIEDHITIVEAVQAHMRIMDLFIKDLSPKLAKMHNDLLALKENPVKKAEELLTIQSTLH
jgi:hypothetical protein